MVHVKRQGKLSDELFARIHSHLDWRASAEFKNKLIHLADAVDCGTVSPMEAYEALEQYETIGYLPEWIVVRASNYSHLF